MKDTTRWKKATVLVAHSDVDKLFKVKVDMVGIILSSANWINILKEFVVNTLKENIPDIIAIFRALELLRKFTIHD
jgi:hypothetical protein